MNTQNKIIILFISSVIIASSVLFFFRRTQQSQNELIVKNTVEQQVVLINTALHVQSDQLDQIVIDYTNWDELIVRMEKPDQSWADDNIASIVKSFKLASVSIYSTEGQLIYGFGKQEKNILHNQATKEQIIGKIKGKGMLHFFQSDKGGILEISASTIHPTLDSTRVQPSAGYFMISRIWNNEMLHELSNNMASSVSLNNINPADSIVVTDDFITVSKHILGYNNEEVTHLVVKKPNNVLINYQKASDFLFFFLSALMFFLISIFFLILYRWIKRPLQIISDSLRLSDTTQLEKLENSKNEFSQIASLISVFHQQKLELEKENIEVNLMQQELIKQKDVLHGMALASNHLLTNDNLDLAIHDALEATSKASNIDRIFIYKNSSKTDSNIRKIELVHEYIVPEIATQIDNKESETILFNRLAKNWFDPLSEGKTVTAFSSKMGEKFGTFLQRQKIQSMMLFPIIDHKSHNLWGIVGFADCSNEHLWTPSEETILGMLAYNIGGAIRRQQNQEKLRNAMEMAKTADRVKSEFLASMSHEIRTPMNGVIGMTSLLQLTELTDNQRDYVNTIENSGENLMNIINEILDFSKIETGKMDLEESSFSLRMCIEDVLDLMAPKALEKNIEIIYYLDPLVQEFIYGDGFRLRQIIVNLVSNAIKFTEKGEILVYVSLQSNKHGKVMLEFSVKDSGIGIPTEKIDILFSPFTQVDASTTRKYGGTGLGLAISSSLVKLMKGTIWVNSELGKGSDFHFTIQTRFTTPKEEINYVQQSLLNLSNKTVLIVDDNATNRKILTLQCQYWGLEVTALPSGRETLQLLENKLFDVGILDMQMPEMDGIMLAREIRKKYDSEKLPLIMLTSIGYNTESGEVSKLFSFNVNKPIKHSLLSEILLKTLSPSVNEPVVKKKSKEELGEISKKYPFHILVAEDNTINQKLIKNIFELLGYRLDMAANGIEALDALKRKFYDLIFMDIQMPEMNGYEATGIIVQRRKEQRPVIIAMTANAMRGDREKCMQAGMDDYITKPMRIDDLIKVIEFWGQKKFNSTEK